MSDTTGTPAEGTPDSTPTEALQLADQQPIAAAPVPSAAPAPAAPSRNHTRTILEVAGGVVAAGLIVAAGAVGFAVGHVTGDDDGRWSMTSDSRGHDGPDAGAPMPGQGEERSRGEQRYFEAPGQGQGQPGMPGFGHQDDDGDGFMGQDDSVPAPQDGTTTPPG